MPTESEIMNQLGVSRTVVREAISRLQAGKLVQTRHGIGTFVLEPQQPESFLGGAASELTVRDVMAILELRISLEAEAAGLAALRRTDENLKEMRRSTSSSNMSRSAPAMQWPPTSRSTSNSPKPPATVISTAS
jgi:DNA-binding FadR family transcriptional regulator